MKKMLFVLLLGLSGLSFGVTEEQIIGKYSLYEKHETVTGVGFGYDYELNFYKESNKLMARYQVSGRGVAIDYICNVNISSNSIVLTFSKFSEDYDERDKSKTGDHVLTLIPSTKNDSVIFKVKGELGEMSNPTFYKQ